MISRSQVLQVVEQHGPVIANKIKQLMQQPDSTLVNVYLSELMREKQIGQTKVKLGSSQFYYTPRQVAKLHELIPHLNEKERRVASRLQEEKVMRAGTVDPLTRVALQQITDFAKPLSVKTSQGEERFYKFYSVPSDEAQQKIRQILGVTTTEKAAVKAPSQPKKAVEKPKKETPKPEKQVTLDPKESSPFLDKIRNILEKKDARVAELKEIRKGKEAEGVVRLKTGLGDITFFAKIKDKKTSNDGDLAEAILAGKAHMLPALYLTTGTVTKKAKQNPYLQEITVVELGNSN